MRSTSLAHILGGGANSRLYRALVIEQRIANNAGAWYQGTSLDATRFGLYATPASRRRAGQGRGRDRRRDRGDFSTRDRRAEELERAKSRMIADYVYAQDNQSTLARMYGAALTTGSTRRGRCRRVPSGCAP